MEDRKRISIREHLAILNKDALEVLEGLITPGTEAYIDEALTNKILETTPNLVAGYFRKSRIRHLLTERQTERVFRRNLDRRYREGLLAFKDIGIICRSAGEFCLGLHQEKYGDGGHWSPTTSPENELRDHTLTRLHARACLIYSEVDTLLRAGFASGAMARRRTLFELLVVAKFIAEFGDRAAEAYWDSEHIGRLRDAFAFNAFYADSPDTKHSPSEMSILQENVENLKRKYQKEFTRDWGWAAHVLGRKRMTFQELVEIVDYDHRKVFLQASHNYVHAGARGTQFNIGQPFEHRNRQLLAGASNAGLHIPAVTAMEEMADFTRIILGSAPSPVGIGISMYLVNYVIQAANLFFDAADQLHNEETEFSTYGP